MSVQKILIKGIILIGCGQLIKRYLETPFNEYFYKNTIYLALETLIFLLFGLIDSSRANLYYGIYCYICLIHTVIGLYFWYSSMSPRMQLKLEPLKKVAFYFLIYITFQYILILLYKFLPYFLDIS